MTSDSPQAIEATTPSPQPPMRAAMLETRGSPLTLRHVARPHPRNGEVLVRIRATAALPHQRLAFAADGPFQLPALPAVVGWDATGEVCALGPRVHGLEVGDRVYLQPIVTCGMCAGCRGGAPLTCDGFMLQGGFGLGPASSELQRWHDGGGFAEYMRVNAANAVRLPDKLSFDEGVRLGYAGVSYRALQRGGAGVGKAVLIMGATGNLGVPATGLALAMGADRVFAVARDRDRLAALASWLDDARLTTLSVAEGEPPLLEQIASATNGRGADIVIDLLDASRGTTARSVESGIACLAANGVAVLTGAMFEPLSVDYMSLLTHDRALIGSHGYTPPQLRDLVSMIDSGAFEFPPFTTRRFDLDRVNQAIDFACSRPGGLTNVVVTP